MVTKYQERISGPLLDRIDIHIEVPRVLENLRKPFASESRLRESFNMPDSPISNPLIFFATQICASGRSGNFADCRLKVKA
jgi:hypothetical protein